MPTELLLYNPEDGIFKQVLNQSSTINGRYFVAPHGTEDLNTNNLSQYLTDEALGVIAPDKKYPLALCLAPRSIIREGREVYVFTIFFLARHAVDQINSDALVSERQAWDDWNHMKEVAYQFIKKLNERIKANYKPIMGIVSDTMEVNRFTEKSSDSLNGARLQFRLEMNLDCENNDYL